MKSRTEQQKDKEEANPLLKASHMLLLSSPELSQAELSQSLC